MASFARPLRLAAQAAAVAVVAALLGLLVWKVVKSQESDVPSAIRAGKSVRAPSFTLPRLDRPGELSLASLLGKKAVVLNFWASYCAPCREETPLLERTWRKYRSRGVVFIGIDTRDFEGDARAFLRRYDVTYPIVRDGAGKLWAPYGVRGLPETFFVGRSGKLVGLIAGGIGDDEVDELERYVELAIRS